MAIETIKCKVKILCHLSGVYTRYQPEIGKIYDADYREANHRTSGQVTAPVCVITILNKRICLRRGEYEIVEE